MSGSKGRGGMLAAIVAVGLLLGGVAWGQQTPDCVGLEITPARVERDLRWTQAYDVTVRNCTEEPLRITTGVNALGHDLDGAPEFFDSTHAEQALRIDDGGTFTLQPGTHRTLSATATIQQPDRSLYAGVVAEFQRIGSSAATSIETRSRVASMLLMRGPKPWKESIAVVDVGLTPNQDGTYTVHAAVENTGNVHVKPGGRITIVKDGEVLDTVRLNNGIILPGFKRRLVGMWTPSEELDGKVRLNAEISPPPASGSAEIDFSSGDAIVPAARITSLVASDAGGAYLEVTMQNIGRGPITPTIEVVVEEGEFERARMNFPQTDPVEPGGSRTAVWKPELADGTYRVTARVVLDEELLDEKVTGLRIGAAPALDGGGGMPLWVVILASMLLLIVLAALMFVVARKRRDDEQPPTPPVEQRRELARIG